MTRRTWTDNNLINAAKNSTSIRQVLIKLNLSPQGGSYEVIKRYINKLDIDISHFTGTAWNDGSKAVGGNKSMPLSEVLVNGIYYKSDRLRKRLLKAGLFEPKCSNCNNTKWLDGPIPLELDHIDGNKNNNLITNLRLLCPNCHSLTPNYRGRKLRNDAKRICPTCANKKNFNSKVCYLCARKDNYKKSNTCLDCNKEISQVSLRCKSCEAKRRPTKIDWPSTQQLVDMVKETSYSEIGRKLGVSDNAIRKRILNHQ